MKRFLILVALIVVLLFAADLHSQPRGKWSSWRQFYSKSEGEIIEVMKFENGWFRNLNRSGDPFSGKTLDLIRCNSVVLAEIQQEER